MNIQETFISLTDQTYCLGDEHFLLDRLPKELKEDEVGNYYMEIGETETMFCCHLDTAAFEMEKVVHDIFQNKKGDTGIGTSGDTILGADDKAGVVILMNLIENKIPGLYYFFIGEEKGTVGSSDILKKQEEKFKKYKRCIAFDRRDYGSVITKQRGRACCSSEFADALIVEYGNSGMVHKQDPFGIYTDSAIFVDIIPECTNISVGYFHEHTVQEVQNITYLERLADASVKVKWEELPTKREPKSLDTPNPKRGLKTAYDLPDDMLEEIFMDVDDLMESVLHVYCFNFDNFIPEKEMVYIDYYNDDNRYSVFIHEDGSISVGKNKFETFEDFEEAMKTYYGHKPNKKKYNKYNYINDDSPSYDDNEEPPWYTEKDKDDVDYDEITSNEDLSKLGSTFTKGLDIQDFVMDILSLVYETGRNYLTVKEINNLLVSKNKTIESFIMWLYDRDNNPDKTYGLTWDDDKNQLLVDDEGAE